MWWLIGDVVAHRRCGGSLVALQTTEAVVPGSNPASLTVKNSEDRQGVYSVFTVKSLGRKGNLPLRKKNKAKKPTNQGHIYSTFCELNPM